MAAASRKNPSASAILVDESWEKVLVAFEDVSGMLVATADSQATQVLVVACLGALTSV